jgi:hypothetical protein
MDGLSDNFPSIHPPKKVSERWDGQTQNGSKIACLGIAIRTEREKSKALDHRTIRCTIESHGLTVIQVSRGRGRGLRSSRPSPHDILQYISSFTGREG